MTGDINNIIGAAHHKNITLVIDKAGIRGFVISREFFQIGCQKTLIIVPQRGKRARRQRQFGHQRTDFAGRQRVAVFIDGLQGPARRRFGGRTFFNRKMMQSQTITGNGPAGFGLPPVIDHRNLQVVFSPFQSVRIQALTGQKKGFKIGQIVIFHQFSPGIFAFNGPKCSGGGKHDFDVMFGYDPPEDTGIRGAHRFAFK